MPTTTAGRLEYVYTVDLSQLAAGMQKANQQMQTFAQQQQQSLGAVGTTGQRVGNQLTQAHNQATEAAGKHKSMLEMLEWRLKYLAISTTVYAGMAGIGAVTAGFTAATVAGIKFNAMMEQSTIAFTSMLGSVSAAGDMLSKIYRMAAESPFDFPQYVTGAQRLIAYGVAAEDVEKTLRAIADATAAVGGSTDVFNRMSFSMGQMVSQGKITAREMRELAMAGIPAWKLLAEQMGMTVGELQKLSETSGIAASTGIPALIAGIEKYFGGMTAKMMDTWSGLTTTIKDEITQMMGFAEEGIFETLKAKLTGIRDWLLEFNAEAKKVGFMDALATKAPGVAQALDTIKASLSAVGDMFKATGTVISSIWGAIPEQLRPVVIVMAELGASAFVISKVVGALVSLKTALLGVRVATLTTEIGSVFGMMFADIAKGLPVLSTLRAGLSLIGTTVLTVLGPMAAVGVAIGALGYAYVQHKKHTQELKAQTDALAGSSKTLAESMSLGWGDVAAAQYNNASQASADFKRQNEALIEQLQRFRGDTAVLSGYALQIAYELQLHGMTPEETTKAVQAIFDAADVTLPVKVGEVNPAEYVDAAAEIGRALQEELAAAQAKWGTWQGFWQANPITSFRGLFDSSAKGSIQKEIDALQVQVAAQSGVIGTTAGEAFTAGYIETIGSLASAPDFQAAAQAFANTLGDTVLAKGQFVDFVDFMRQAASAGTGALQDFASIYSTMLAQTGDSALAFAIAERAIAASVDPANNKLADQAARLSDLKTAIDEATKAWANELAAQYDMGSAISNALRKKQQAMNDAASAQNSANQKAAEAQKKIIDKQTDAEIKAIERVRDARLDALKEEEKQRQKQLSQSQSIGDVFGIQIAEDHIAALQAEQNAVRDKATEEIEAAREAATAQKEAIEAVKVSAGEAALSLQEITDALADANRQADEYLRNLAALPPDIAEALRDSGLTPEEKRKLAEELVAGSDSDRQRAFTVLRDSLRKRNDEAAKQMAAYYETSKAAAKTGGGGVVDAFVNTLSQGAGKIQEAVGDYAQYIVKALNPILKALGKPEITLTLPGLKIPSSYGTIPFAAGGFLPNQATIQNAVGPAGLVQWAEPSTKGEAFIPLAPEKRDRSLQIWEETGRLLGAFAEGGFTALKQPTSLPEPGDVRLSLAHVGNLAMDALYDAARQWILTKGTFDGGGGLGFNLPSNLPDDIRGEIVRYAASFFGVPYLWGGMSPAGFDCSGLVSYVFAHFGIDLPHWARSQQQYGRGVSTTAALPADLVFFGTPAHHVGIYIGNGQMIDAPHDGAVVRIDSAFAGDFSGARSIFANGGIRSYDKGGVLQPGLTLAYNGTGRPEVVTSYANGGLSATYGTWTGGTTELKWTEAEEKLHAAAMADYTKATAAVTVFAARLERLAAQGASAAEQMGQLNEQIAATEAQTAAARKMLELAVNAGATEEQLAELRVNIINLDTSLANLRSELDRLELQPLIDQFNRWGQVISRTQMLMDLLSNSSQSFALQTAMFPQLMGQLGGQYQSALDLMNASTNPADISNYADQALSSLNAMFNAEKAQLDRTLSDTQDSIDDSQRQWEDAWQTRYDAAQKAIEKEGKALDQELKKQQDTHQKELDELNDFYEKRLQALRDADTAITREQQRNKAIREAASLEDQLRILRGQGYYTEADISKMRDLETQIQERHDAIAQQDAAWARQDEITRLERERDEQRKSLEQQQKAAQESLQAQVEADREALQAKLDAMEEERRLKEIFFEEQRQKAQQAYQDQLDLVVQKYAEMMQQVIEAEKNLLGEEGEYYNAGYTLGQQFAQGIIDSIPEIQAAALEAAQAVSDALELHSPAKDPRSRLHYIEEWWKPLAGMLVRPLKDSDILAPVFDTYGPAGSRGQNVVRKSEEVIRVVLESVVPNDQDVIDRLADAIETRIQRKVENRRYSF